MESLDLKGKNSYSVEQVRSTNWEGCDKASV